MGGGGGGAGGNEQVEVSHIRQEGESWLNFGIPSSQKGRK